MLTSKMISLGDIILRGINKYQDQLLLIWIRPNYNVKQMRYAWTDVFTVMIFWRGNYYTEILYVYGRIIFLLGNRYKCLT